MQGPHCRPERKKYAAEMPEWHDVPGGAFNAGCTGSRKPVHHGQECGKGKCTGKSRPPAGKAGRGSMGPRWQKAKAKDQRIDRNQSHAWHRQKRNTQKHILQQYQSLTRLNKRKQFRLMPTNQLQKSSASWLNLEEINGKVRAGQRDKQKAIDDAENARQVYNVLTAKGLRSPGKAPEAAGIGKGFRFPGWAWTMASWFTTARSGTA